MNQRRVGLHGVGAESARLLSQLVENPDLDCVRLYEPDAEAARAVLAAVDPTLLDRSGASIVTSVDALLADPPLDVLVDDGRHGSPRNRVSSAAPDGPQIVSLPTARLLWSHGVAPRDRQSELLEVLGEIVASVDLTIDGKELFARMLEIAVAVTGAAGGSLMLLGPEGRELFIQVAFGVEPELWPKIRVPLGDGIAGRVAAEARPILISGRADAEHYRIVRERVDVASALCVPLVHEGRVLGVLNLHHNTRTDVFDEHDLAFMERIAALDAAIIRRAQTHAALRARAARYEATREVHALLGGPAPLGERLRSICAVVARRLGDGIATIYLPDDSSDERLYTLAASSLSGSGAGARTAVRSGVGLDGEVARTGEAILLRDGQGRLRYAALPLIFEGRVEGVLAVQVGRMEGEADELEANLAEVAEVIAEGVVRSRREARATAHALRVSAAHEAGLRLVGQSDPQQIAQSAAASLAMLLGAEHVVVRLEDPTNGRFQIASYFGGADDQAQYALFALDKAATIETIRRRTLQLVRDLPVHPKLGPFAGSITSMISAPLKIDGRIVGCVAVYDKLAADTFFSGRFNEDDLQVISHFVGDFDRALAASRTTPGAGARSVAGWRSRVGEELLRAADRPGELALSICSLEDFDALLSNGEERAHEALARLETALRAELRPFDHLVRLDERRFGVLLPEPGPDASESVRRLARAVSERVASACAQGSEDDVRIVLGFGFATNERGESDAAGFEARAEVPRIVMV